jgi:Domain of unknown function DUF11
VRNGGPNAASNVALNVTPGTGLAFLSASSSQGGCSGTGPVTCSIGTLGNGASATVKITARVLASGSLASVASAHSDQSDPVGSNNTDVVAATLLPPPVPGKKVNAERVSGIVLVDGRELTSPEQVRVGATIDTKNGEVRLVTRNGDAKFHDGVFQLHQQASKNAVTELAMKGGDFAKSCKQTAALASLETPLKAKKPVRQLWGHGKGRFRTRGRFSSATVRGTEWLTADRCDGTLTQVKSGTVTVLDFVKHKTVKVHAGQSYLAGRQAAQAKHKGARAKRRRRH